ncbi:MAG: Wzz/FepE/Etk N-terminal domain-containing protein [Lachnospiraceae bacterium]|jgi:capsular polysaccharide biosynthesis protein|nr:Wzz/FepE/Etk N-terminal domain-containing protein [Clostridium sp. OF09-10]RHV95307.1 polysaccharide export protein [Clostridium sp. OF09-10]
MEKKFEDDDEIEIDLLELFYALRHRWWAILLALVIGAGAAGVYTKKLIAPHYQSTSMVYVLSKETTLASLADLQIGSQLTKDYSVIIKSRPVLQEVIDKQNLDLTTDELGEMITIDNPKDTRILSITVEDIEPMRAKAIVDEVTKSASNYIGDIMEMVPPKVIEDGVVAVKPSSPSVKKNAAVGGLGLAVLVCGLICLKTVLDDTIKSEEDIEKYLGLSVLAVIPDTEKK